ncbi:MAG: phosphopantetheine-binding protein [Xanthobacteraceae bacterium]
MQEAADTVGERTAALVRGLLARRLIAPTVGRDDDLNECGLNSLDLVNLMLAVEAEFDLKIPDLDMRPANFRSMARIEALVTGLMRVGEPVGGG